jgi:hypothetical protein
MKRLKDRIQRLEAYHVWPCINKEVSDALADLSAIMQNTSPQEFAEMNLKAATELTKQYQEQELKTAILLHNNR